MNITRRNALKIIGATPVAAGVGLGEAAGEPRHAGAHPQAPGQTAAAARTGAYTPKFFTAHEWATVGLLADLIIPKDERSGSATDAGVPEFIDFMMVDRPDGQVPMRGGLAWLDAESRARFGRSFREAADAERTALLDDIAYPRAGRPEFSHGVAFFSRFRDMVATGFWTSKMGIADLQYMGNVADPGWDGCPDTCYAHLGVTKTG